MTAHTETHKITFTRDMDRALQVKGYRNAVDLLIDGISTKSITTRGWSFDEDMAGFTEHSDELTAEERDGGKINRRYRWSLNVSFASATTKPGKSEFASIVYTLYGRAIKPAGGRWVITEVDGEPYSPPSDDQHVTDKIDKEMIGYADCAIPDDVETYFEHLYGLESHIARTLSALRATMASGWKDRYNTVLSGPPGCGKSDIALSLKKALGDDAVMSFDATSTTAAGLIKTLNDADIMPRVIIFEEIEKAGSETMVPLLGIADQRGEINKTTARGSVDKSVKAFCIATVNDFEKFNTMQSGALGSRFPNKVHFKRPTREVAMRILRREIAKVEGDQDWAEPAYKYCESRGIVDVREMIAVCMVGGDDLLSGEYQRMMDETGTPYADEAE